MAKYRQVHTTFWDDGFVIDLTPEEKYFYLYLMTNNNTTQCGIYELPYRVIEMHTGYNRDTVLKLLERFTEYGKIVYNVPTKEIMLANWAKYNFINSPKVKKCIEKELQSVKHKPFVNMYLNSLSENGYGIDTVSIPLDENSATKVSEPSNDRGSIPYQYPIDSLCIDLGEEEEREEEREEEQEREREEKKNTLPPSFLVDHNFLQVKKYFETKVIYQESSYKQAQDLGYMIDDYDKDLIMQAMDIAVERGKPNLSYINGILRTWRTDGITNINQLQAKEAQGNAKHRTGDTAKSGTSKQQADERLREQAKRLKKFVQ